MLMRETTEPFVLQLSRLLDSTIVSAAWLSVSPRTDYIRADKINRIDIENKPASI